MTGVQTCALPICLGGQPAAGQCYPAAFSWKTNGHRRSIRRRLRRTGRAIPVRKRGKFCFLCGGSRVQVLYISDSPAVMKEHPQFGRPPLRKWTALLCVLVMAGFGLVQAVHVHNAVAGQSAPASHCSLCVVAHSAALISPSGTAPVLAYESAQIALLEPQLQSRLHVASSHIRPPPQNL